MSTLASSVLRIAMRCCLGPRQDCPPIRRWPTGAARALCPARLPEPAAATLVFWKRPPDGKLNDLLVSWITGCDACAVAVDFQVGEEEDRWLITSDQVSVRAWSINGPHFVPARAQRNAGWVRIDMSRLLDSGQLWNDLTAAVGNPRIRHKGLAPIAYLPAARTRKASPVPD